MISKIWCIFRLAMENNSIPFWNPQFLCNDTGQEPKISNNRCVYKNNLKIFLIMNHYTHVKVGFSSLHFWDFPSEQKCYVDKIILSTNSLFENHFRLYYIRPKIISDLCKNIFMKKTFKSYFSLFLRRFSQFWINKML